MLERALCEDCEFNPVEYRAFLCKPDGTVLLEMNICMDCLKIVSTTFLEEAKWHKKQGAEKANGGTNAC